jgi:ATP-dependent Lhr-like helicase
MQLHARQTAELIEKYGKAAAVALSARRVSAADVRAVLEKEPKVSDKFYELILEVERKVLSRRFK